MAKRDLDVVVFGASGVTGRRVAAYLAEQSATTGVRWAAAGRDAAKVGEVLATEGGTAPVVIAADVSEPASLAAMAARARVVLNLVGPYTVHGLPVIEACVAEGAHYVDLTGEIPFVRRVVDAFHERATEAGVKIVQVCGFEALPADLAVALAAEAARQRHGEEIVEADVQVRLFRPRGRAHANDFISGGTLQSLAEAAGDPDAELVTDPAALVPDQERASLVRRLSPIAVAPRRIAGGVLAPMAPAAFINPAVIQRSRMLADAAPIRYREGTVLPGPAPAVPFLYLAAGALSGVQAGVGRLTRSSVSMRNRVSSGLRRLLPDSGFGPDTDRMEGWRWTLWAVGRTSDGSEVGVDVDAEGHPGYLATARMIGEAGALLAEPGSTPKIAGCVTPSAALGTGAAPRFERARIRFAAS